MLDGATLAAVTDAPRIHTGGPSAWWACDDEGMVGSADDARTRGHEQPAAAWGDPNPPPPDPATRSTAWDPPATTTWPTPPWGTTPDEVHRSRRRTALILGLSAVGAGLVAWPLFLLGVASLLAGVGLLILPVAALLYLSVVPLGLSSLYLLLRTKREPLGTWLLCCLPGFLAVTVWVGMYVYGLLN